MKRLQPGDRVLVIRPGALGDTILTLPAVRALRRMVEAPGEIDWVGYPASVCLAINPLHASAVHSIDRSLFAGLFSEPTSSELDRFVSSYDLVVAWCRDDTHRLRRLLTRLNVAFIQKAPFPAPGSALHASDHLLLSLGPIVSCGGASEGMAHDPSGGGAENVEAARMPELVLSREAHALGDRLLRALGLQTGSFLAIHPGSGSAHKNWSPAKFSHLARLARKGGLGVLVIEGISDKEPVRKLLESLDWLPQQLHTKDLAVLAHILSQATAYVGNDSGISHLAAASGAPTLVLFGPTDPKIWAPRGRFVRIFSLSTPAEEVWSTIERQGC
jgi:hypothetical protein